MLGLWREAYKVFAAMWSSKEVHSRSSPIVGLFFSKVIIENVRGNEMDTDFLFWQFICLIVFSRLVWSEAGMNGTFLFAFYTSERQH